MNLVDPRMLSLVIFYYHESVPDKHNGLNVHIIPAKMQANE